MAPEPTDRIFVDPELRAKRASGEIPAEVDEFPDIKPIFSDHPIHQAPRPKPGALNYDLFRPENRVGTSFSGQKTEWDSGSVVFGLLIAAIIFGVLASFVVGFFIGSSAAISLYIIMLLTYIAVKD